MERGELVRVPLFLMFSPEHQAVTLVTYTEKGVKNEVFRLSKKVEEIGTFG